MLWDVAAGPLALAAAGFASARRQFAAGGLGVAGFFGQFFGTPRGTNLYWGQYTPRAGALDTAKGILSGVVAKENTELLQVTITVVDGVRATLGSYVIALSASDGVAEASVETSFPLILNETNTPPQPVDGLRNTVATLREEFSLNLPSLFRDPAYQEELTYAVSSLPAGLTLNMLLWPTMVLRPLLPRMLP